MSSQPMRLTSFKNQFFGWEFPTCADYRVARKEAVSWGTRAGARGHLGRVITAAKNPSEG